MRNLWKSRPGSIAIVVGLMLVMFPALVSAGKPPATPAKTLVFSEFNGLAAVGRPWWVTVNVTKGGVLDTKDSRTVVKLRLATGAGASLSGAVTATARYGVARFFVSYPLPEVIFLQAYCSDTTVGPTAYQAVSIESLKLRFEIQTPSTPQMLGAAWPSFMLLTTLGGNPFNDETGTVVTLSASGGATGALSGTLTSTLVNGSAIFSGISYNRAETITVSASSSDTNILGAVSNPVTVDAVRLVFDLQPVSPEALYRTWPAFSVKAMFAGAVYPAATGTVTLAAGAGATGALQGTPTSMLVNGVATFSQVTYNRDETITVNATSSDPSILGAVSNPVVVDYLRLVFDLQPRSLAPLGFSWPAFTVKAMLAGAVYPMTEYVQVSASGGASGALSGILEAMLVNGTATFSAISYGQAETITVSATSRNPGFLGTVSNPVTVTPVSLVFDPPPASTQSLFVAWAPFGVRTMLDGAPCAITSGFVTLSRSSGGSGVIGGTLSVPLVDGVATFTYVVYANYPETITVAATASDTKIAGSASAGPILIKNALQARYVFPTSGSTSVPVRPLIRAVFTEAVDPASVRLDAFSLSGPGGLVPASFVFSGGNTVVDLIPDDPLVTGASHTLSVTAGVTDAYGLPLQYPQSVSFTTESRGWGGPVTVNQGWSYSTYGVTQLSAAYSVNGKAMVVFDDGYGYLSYRIFSENLPSAYAVTYDSWDRDIHLVTAGTIGDHYPDLAMDDQGNALLTYVHDYVNDVRAIAYDSATATWSAPVVLGSRGNYQDSPALDMAGSGRAVAAWSETVAGGCQVKARLYQPGSGWGAAAALSTIIGKCPAEPVPVRAAINGDGRAVVAWNQPSDYAYDLTKQVTVAVFDPTGLFWTISPLGNPHQIGIQPQVGIDDAGRAVCVFGASFDPYNDALLAAHFNGAFWGIPGFVHVGQVGTISSPSLALSPNGDGTMVFLSDLGGIKKPTAVHYLNGLWQNSFQGLGPYSLAGSNPSVSRDDYGNAIVIYKAGGGVFASRYVAGTGWTDIFGYYLGSGSVPGIAVSPFGNAIATFVSGSNGTALRFASGE